ncbi:FkbM family methyltransferase [Pelagibacteraceae bacterium]|nr:FkbM family methyltransferase [Pelagibacteraceae bacterium]
MQLDKFEIYINNNTIPFHYKKVSQDMSSYFAKIIRGDIYKKINIPKKINMIVDIGANFGAASLCFAFRYPEATIFSLEPVTETFKILEKNTSAFKTINPFNLAASNSTGVTDIYIDKNKMGRSSLIKNHLNYFFDYVEKIQSIKFMDFLEENNIEQIDILKIDVEGSECKIIDSIKPFLKKIACIYIESHTKDNFKKINNILLESHLEVETVNHKDYLFESIYLNNLYKNTFKK